MPSPYRSLVTNGQQHLQEKKKKKKKKKKRTKRGKQNKELKTVFPTDSTLIPSEYKFAHLKESSGTVKEIAR
jgi:hypothetical protein